MILPDFLTRHAAELPAAGAIAAAVALVVAVVFLTGRGRRRAEPVVGHYQCHSCRAPDAVALVRLPHERLARLACIVPECRVAYAVVPDDGDAVGTLHRAHKAYLRVMVRGAPPRNNGRSTRTPEGKRKAAAVPVEAVPAAAEPATDWSNFGPVPLPGPVKLVESDAPPRNAP